MNALVWLQREFRIDYLPALQAALANHEQVLVAYIHDTENPPGAATQLWLAHALQQLQKDYQSRGGKLAILAGKFTDCFTGLIKDFDIGHVYYSFQVGETFSAQQNAALQICQQQKIKLQPFYSEDFFQHHDIKNQKGSPYLVFTPYYKNCQKMLDQLQPLELSPKDLKQTALLAGVDDYQKVPQNLMAITEKKWARKMMAYWQVGESAAWQRYTDFSEQALADYDNKRDFPSIDATSRLSPYLHFGHINPVAIYFDLLSQAGDGRLSMETANPWIRQLFWRSFSHYLLVWFPEKEKKPFQEKYQAIRWDDNEEGLLAWQQGLTGIPIVDAGMRELWETGTMHNRVRMLVASVLSKNLNIDWLYGLQWFEDTLFDADPGNNSMGWQWVAGCGVDAAPYYRLFNPVVQSQKFDAQGKYIKKWLPELKALSSKAIHEPWNHKMECEMKGIQIGKDYPQPIVDLKDSRDEHLARVQTLKQAAQ